MRQIFYINNINFYRLTRNADFSFFNYNVKYYNIDILAYFKMS